MLLRVSMSFSQKLTTSCSLESNQSSGLRYHAGQCTLLVVIMLRWSIIITSVIVFITTGMKVVLIRRIKCHIREHTAVFLSSRFWCKSLSQIMSLCCCFYKKLVINETVVSSWFDLSAQFKILQCSCVFVGVQIFQVFAVLKHLCYHTDIVDFQVFAGL